MSEKQQLGFALAALAGGIAWGTLRYRDSNRAGLLALLQSGSSPTPAAIITWLRETVEAEDLVIDEDDERVTAFRRVAPSTPAPTASAAHRTPAVARVLVVYDGRAGLVRGLAQHVGVGVALVRGATPVLLDVDADQDELLSADALILGSPTGRA